EKAFQELKKYLGAPPLFSMPMMGERLYLYLAVSENTVSSALIRVEDGVQKRIYYTSKAFRGAEIKYPRLENLALALIEA
ncbi:RNase H-like domain-containing protein, partial [Acinetobacter baumannii]|uniref:RNase H-like domain-containing protein n=1 Tax=Acinetobacter baumannii TaxID=470 RepID=UPI0013D60270